MGHSQSLFLSVHYKICWRLDLNRRLLAAEVTALPTESQELPNQWLYPNLFLPKWRKIFIPLIGDTTWKQYWKVIIDCWTGKADFSVLRIMTNKKEKGVWQIYFDEFLFLISYYKVGSWKVIWFSSKVGKAATSMTSPRHCHLHQWLLLGILIYFNGFNLVRPLIQWPQLGNDS